QCQGVHEAVVLSRADIDGQNRLVAYVTPQPGHELATTQLRSELADQLPDYMLPSAFVVLAELPLTPNGKIDRKALPALESSEVSDRYVAPRNATEAAVSQVWATLLQTDRVGVTDNFFDLGGHSLLLVSLHQQLDQMYPGRLAMSDFFTHTTVEQIAAFLGGEQDQEAPAQQGVSRAEARKRSAAQQRERRSKLGRQVTTGR
ncbi:phosphopantetheine-binding protein, partial [Roseateles sp. SL47]|uniref:phosphopantetheine-binding protein n=1 Tax=Roseateles sp. SL47 TaxID=2995138 RepID=UPI002270BE87